MNSNERFATKTDPVGTLYYAVTTADLIEFFQAIKTWYGKRVVKVEYDRHHLATHGVVKVRMTTADKQAKLFRLAGTTTFQVRVDAVTFA
ncbi:hypothetical protein QDW26_gp16 [Microbacterium phage Didgeridoo]|uniref:hypothetical protein n=1 Tax=Microbacterium phage Didgeridoo TaxID=2126928 RepID=UPI0010FC2F14|nr:hypothetical protein QDW26_gp16 [Microbacterium phage Didgeridoo]AVR56741.2 hypothetical protein PBI_DIDGERIDOO_77 [Microbacterium phage Didgeridoo]